MRVFGPTAPPDPCIPRPQYACGTTHGGQQAGTAPAICNRKPATISAMTRTFFFSPKAWMRGEMAHCSYYKNNDVTKDVAGFIADWNNTFKPNPHWPIGAWFKAIARWLIVARFCSAFSRLPSIGLCSGGLRGD